MRRRSLVGVAVLYVVMAVITFGHSASNYYAREWPRYVECEARAKADPKHQVCLGVPGDVVVGAAVGGLVAGMFWPLYWSWEAWS